MENVKKNVQDIQRQQHKTCIIVFGEGVPSPWEGEQCGPIFARLAREKYGIIVGPKDVMACHRLGSKKIICQFVHRYPGTPYYQLLTAAQAIQVQNPPTFQPIFDKAFFKK